MRLYNLKMFRSVTVALAALAASASAIKTSAGAQIDDAAYFARLANYRQGQVKASDASLDGAPVTETRSVEQRLESAEASIASLKSELESQR